MTPVRTPHLGEVSPEHVARALARFQLGELVGLAPVRQGVAHQTIFVDAASGPWVLRGKPHFPGQFERERCFTDLLHTWTRAPVPWPYLHDPGEDIFGWSYVLMPRLPGRQLGYAETQAALTPRDWHGIAEACGAALAEAHRLTWPPWPAHPFPFPAVFGQPEQLGEGYALAYAASVEEALEAVRSADPAALVEDEGWVRQVLAEARPALATPGQACVVLDDVKDGNLTVDQVEGAWRVTGMFDYMFAHFGDGETDLARLYDQLAGRDPALGLAYLDAYRRARPCRPGFELRQRLYVLRDRLAILAYAREQALPWFPTGMGVRALFEGLLPYAR